MVQWSASPQLDPPVVGLNPRRELAHCKVVCLPCCCTYIWGRQMTKLLKNTFRWTYFQEVAFLKRPIFFAHCCDVHFYVVRFCARMSRHSRREKRCNARFFRFLWPCVASYVGKQLDSVESTKWICVERISLNECISDAGHGFYTRQIETRHRPRKWRQDLHRGELSRSNF
jgi:hypothetical protein